MKKKMLILGIVISVICSLFYRILIEGQVVYANESSLKTIPEIYIKAVNPGYIIDGVSNVGEMIEIARRDSDHSISLAGITIGYTNSSGNDSVLIEFPENSWMTGETILLRLASSPGSELAAVNYTKTLAMKGGLTLKRDEEVLDEICWTGKENCYKEFKTAKPTTLVRNLESGEFEHVEGYEPKYDEQSYYEESEQTDGLGEQKMGRCRGMEFSEILSYYETSSAEQFIELHNSNAEQVLMDGCQIRYKNRMYDLTGIVKADEYFVYYPTEFSLTKNPANSNKIELLDAEGVVDTLVYPNGQRKATAYALVGYDVMGKEIWKVTYAPTPGAPNNYQEYKTCEVGKVINEATGNCVKATTVTEKVCPEGQYLNVLTGRCKKYTTGTEKTCKEGYYLNPETNRCRKIQENNEANYEVKPETYEENSSFVALYAILGVVGVGVIYVVYEFRREIGRLFGKVFRRFR